MEGKQILVIDDDPEILEIVKIILERARARVNLAQGGEEGLRRLWQVRPDLVILDIMMDDLSGWRVCQRIREFTDVPIILLSSLDEEKHIMRALSAGCDDYISKPVKPNTLLARAGALLNREQPQLDGEPAYDDGYLRVDLRGKRVEVNGCQVKLTPTEFSLLELLVRHNGRLCAMAQIQTYVWGGLEQVTPQTVHVFISQLRKKIEPDPGEPRYIRSEYGMGYRFG